MELNFWTHPGVVEFLGPPDFVPSQQFGANGYWIRALFEAGDDPPVQLRTMLLNTTFAAQTVTLRNEVLGSSDASVNQRFRTTRSPVLAGPQLEVREPGQPSADELAALGASGVTVITPTAGPRAKCGCAGSRSQTFMARGLRTDTTSSITSLARCVSATGFKGAFRPAVSATFASRDIRPAEARRAIARRARSCS